MDFNKIKNTVCRLAKVSELDITLLDDKFVRINENGYHLTPWRYDRKLITLRNLGVIQNRLKTICSYKSSNVLNNNVDIDYALFVELDVCEWILNDVITSVYALSNRNKTLSLILRTKKGVLCNIEISTTLALDSTPIKRHEIVGREGMISDRSINEQIPAKAVYLFNDNKGEPTTFTDVDSNMFGLTQEEVYVADNVLNILSNKPFKNQVEDRINYLNGILKCVKKSLETGEVQYVEV